MTAPRVVSILLSASVSGVAAGEPELRRHNATADVLVRQGVRLGLDFGRGDEKAPHPTADEVRAAPRTGFGAWLNAELARPDDAITDPPSAFRDYLEERRGEFWAIVAALENGPPDWGQRPKDVEWTFPALMPTLALERILLAAALCRERDGDSIAAGRILEASWSLGRPVAEGDFLIHQLLAVGISKLQAGGLRKIRSPSAAWMSRLSGVRSWTRMLDAVERESAPESALSKDPSRRALDRLNHAVAANFRKVSPCEASRQTDDEIWSAVKREVETDPRSVVRSTAEEPPPEPTPAPGEEPDDSPEGRRFYFKNQLTNVTGAIRRAAKLAVDRELTVKILELRVEADASRDGSWPAGFAGRLSHACPGASYVYRKDGDKMEIRFDEVVESAGGEPVLPLSFRAGSASRPGPTTPTRTAEAP